jgi:hypothetical protein
MTIDSPPQYACWLWLAPKCQYLARKSTTLTWACISHHWYEISCTAHGQKLLANAQNHFEMTGSAVVEATSNYYNNAAAPNASVLLLRNVVDDSRPLQQ